MSNIEIVLIKLDEVTKQWMKEANESCYKDGCGKIEPPDPWDEFEQETRELLYG